MEQTVQQSFRRVEKKYLLTPAQYDALLCGIMPYMKANDHGRYTICNIYYDTDSFALIRASLEKPVYKEKLRLRSYGTPTDGKPVFVEIKKKFDHVVYKRRTVMPCECAVEYLAGNRYPPDADQVCREIDWFLKLHQPKPKVFIAYDRTALVGIEYSDLRVTFDTDLRWRDCALDLRMGDHGEKLLTQERILMELKTPGTVPLWLSRLLSELGVFPTSFSKYGLCYKEHLLQHSLPQPAVPARMCTAPRPDHLKEAHISA